ncbi:Peroxisomal membrane protein PEX16 [Escovopsis weberi]|uniref:Peroxisomal membrane protein PEX16 n=1 Tax=Escovopsis weberi TaxID=150374 RepID=A0A0M8N318_ESCWE|nr:Peroxisomal membrane protein PEX16 [Escovopsis weberi]
MPQPATTRHSRSASRPSCRSQITTANATSTTAGQILSAPPKWLGMYDDFITKNAGQVSQIESALRSLTYIIPGRFRDAEIASESIHSGVQLLSLYHDGILSKAAETRLSMPQSCSAHSRYTRFWTQKSTLYRKIATVLQMVLYTELLCEMGAKRRGGEKTRWKVVVVLEAIKAFCRLLLLRVTRSRPLVTPILPERGSLPEEHRGAGDDDDDDEPFELRSESGLFDETSSSSYAERSTGAGAASETSSQRQQQRRAQALHQREWAMPRTGMSMPSLPHAGDISSYLLGRVLSADDIKPANTLLNTLYGSSQLSEILHILAPLIYALALYRSNNKKSWTPWLLGLAVEYAARQFRDRGLRTTALERDEWNRRGWAMVWWLMRGAFYQNVTKSAVKGVTRRMPGFLAGIFEDYEYLWENYFFSTSG